MKTLRIQFLRFLGMENLGSDEKARFKKIVHEAFMSFYSNSEGVYICLQKDNLIS